MCFATSFTDQSANHSGGACWLPFATATVMFMSSGRGTDVASRCRLYTSLHAPTSVWLKSSCSQDSSGFCGRFWASSDRQQR